MRSSGPSGPLAVGVVVPARDEAARIDRCLAAVAAAAGMLRRSGEAPADIRVVVVADACADRTVDRLAGWPGVGTVISAAGRVGAARAAGARQLLRVWAADGFSPRRCWIANTDADCVVPPYWLIVHAAAARRGRHLLLGTVRPDPDEIDPRLAGRWYRRHRLTDGHPHVHGANLGVRGLVPGGGRVSRRRVQRGHRPCGSRCRRGRLGGTKRRRAGPDERATGRPGTARAVLVPASSGPSAT